MYGVRGVSIALISLFQRSIPLEVVPTRRHNGVSTGLICNYARDTSSLGMGTAVFMRTYRASISIERTNISTNGRSMTVSDAKLTFLHILCLCNAFPNVFFVVEV